MYPTHKEGKKLVVCLDPTKKKKAQNHHHRSREEEEEETEEHTPSFLSLSSQSLFFGRRSKDPRGRHDEARGPPEGGADLLSSVLQSDPKEEVGRDNGLAEEEEEEKALKHRNDSSWNAIDEEEDDDDDDDDDDEERDGRETRDGDVEGDEAEEENAETAAPARQ